MGRRVPVPAARGVSADPLLRCRPMADLSERLRTRIVPALLTAVGVTMLAVGLLSYTTPVDAGPLGTNDPTPGIGQASPSPLLTLPPLGSAAPATADPSFPADRVATRVRIAALKIDLPVVKPPPGANTYPLCDVAMYLDDGHGALGQPGEGKATYLYAHAREGMFLPILTASKISNGKKMLGMVVEVWTSDDQRFLYEITEVRRHQLEPPGRPDRDVGAALAPDLRRTEGHARQDPGRRLVPVPGGGRSRGGPPHPEAGGLRLGGRTRAQALRSSRSSAGTTRRGSPPARPRRSRPRTRRLRHRRRSPRRPRSSRRSRRPPRCRPG